MARTSLLLFGMALPFSIHSYASPPIPNPCTLKLAAPSKSADAALGDFRMAGISLATPGCCGVTTRYNRELDGGNGSMIDSTCWLGCAGTSTNLAQVPASADSFQKME